MFTVESADNLDVHQKLLAWWLSKKKDTNQENDKKVDNEGVSKDVV